MKTFALLVVLFFADGVENPRPQFVNGVYPVIIEEKNCERAVKNLAEFIIENQKGAKERGEDVPLFTVTCDPVKQPE